jgi:hypothetical protein
MTQVISRLLKINIRARSRSKAMELLRDTLGGVPGHDRGADTVGEFEGATLQLGGVTFDLVVPTSDDAPLARVIEKHGEGIDSLCFAVDDMEFTKQSLRAKGIEFSRLTEFHENQVAFVHPRDACGIALEFIQGPVTEK